jgi:TonB family protein
LGRELSFFFFQSPLEYQTPSPTLEIDMNPRNHSLIRAVTDDDTEAVRALLAAGSDVNKPTSGGQTPLMIAVVFRRIKILSLLLEAGADAQVRDDLGLNAIDWAERKGFAEGVKLLTQNKTAKQESPTDSTKPKLSGSPTPTHVKNTPVSGSQMQNASSDEKSRRWIAGMKRRIDEAASHEVKEGQPRPATEAPSEKEPARVVVNDKPLLASPILASPKPEVFESLPDSGTKGASDTPQLKNQIASSQTKTPIVPRGDVATSQPPSLTITKPPTSSSRKRCPKCNANYNSELLAYCAIDMTPLVDADAPVVPPPHDRSRMPLLWFLVIFTFLIAAAVTYLVFHNSRSRQDNAPATLPKPAANVKDVPLVAGGLSGKQLDVPAPEYPLNAKSEHVSGTVKVRVNVDKEGTVIAVQVVEGDRRLRDAAIAAAQKATFSREKLTGRGAVGTITYTFKE